VKRQVGELSSWCGGELSGASDVVPSGVSIDTRTLERGELFVAIAGEHFDGHDYLETAVERGAAAVLVSRNGTARLPVPAIRVDDTIAALGALARQHRERFAGPVLAITGSNGKTTTKELTADVLAVAGVNVRRSLGNLNNHIGLPLSVLALEPEDEALVVELGMNHAGEIAQLAEIAQPDAGAITQVAPAHLGLLGSLDAIARAKGELLDHIRSGGTAVLNADDERVMSQRSRFSGRELLFGFSAGADFRGDDSAGPEGGFRLETRFGACDVRMRLPGRHLIQDGLCACALAYASGLLGDGALEVMRGALESFCGVPGRLVLRDTAGGITVLDDSYNANPESARAALDTLAGIRGKRRALAVLADMLELGDESPALHAELGREAAAAGVDLLIAVGPLSVAMAEAARAAGLPQVAQVGDNEAAIEELRAVVRTGDVILVKGSRGMAMERAVRALLEEA
jgi:UDP-N-acetylmuramoyl-tripeptide--D-alanyl-D-alanine ligase